jgi:RHS repeat-associated protein
MRPGQRYEAVSGLHYNYFRDYEASTGRYAQSDPIGFAGGISTYGYVGGAPTSATDMYGLFEVRARYTPNGGFSYQFTFRTSLTGIYADRLGSAATGVAASRAGAPFVVLNQATGKGLSAVYLGEGSPVGSNKLLWTNKEGMKNCAEEDKHF